MIGAHVARILDLTPRGHVESHANTEETIMTPADRWKEALVLLSAGSQMVPFGDNGHAYRRLSERLDCLRGTARLAHRPCPPPPGPAFRWESKS